ncbi:MAG: hypothetical protein Q7J68_08620 [Thermoplasmata archaeon]|nr:hypothetical protein [Thermoplasmata archaeon]
MDIYPRYKGRAIIPTRSAYHELEDLVLNLFDVADVLEKGCDCSRSRRKKEKLERCLQAGNKITRVVVADGQFAYSDGYVEDVYWLIHVSVETRKRRPRK